MTHDEANKINAISEKVIGCAFSVANLLVDGLVLIEIKVAKTFDDVHLAQCMNYLRATNFKLCLLINFGTSKIGIKRVVNKL